MNIFIDKILESWTREKILFLSLIIGVISLVYVFVSLVLSYFHETSDLIAYFTIIFCPIAFVAAVSSRISNSALVVWRRFTFIFLLVYLFIYWRLPFICDWDINILCKIDIFYLSAPLYLAISIFITSNILSWMTNKKVFLSSLVLACCSYLLFYVSRNTNSFTEKHIYEGIGYILSIFNIVFLISLINFKLKNSTYIAWRSFSLIFFIIYLIILVPLPARSYSDIFDITKGSVSFVLVILYSVISLALIIYKSSKKE